jgi:FAD/FMN-containing dehydrogenase
MGGQQFATGSLLIDTANLSRAIRLDTDPGLLQMEAGAQWPTVVRATHELQSGDAGDAGDAGATRWGIRQKQTGADALSLGGAVAANVHGRGLLMRPFVDDVDSLRLVTADGQLVECSRQRNGELFSLVCGGYGLFGVVASVTLRLGPRLKIRRLVDILDVDEAIPAVRRRVADGCLYGDFQYAIDPADDGFLRRGVCACYAPVADGVPVSDESADLTSDDWAALLRLAHTDKREAFRAYAAHYLASHGRVYWSDEMQLSTYLPSYDQFVKDLAAPGAPESLVIGELLVPPDALREFLARGRRVLRSTGAEDIYGTIRSILRDETSFLPWARADYACVIFNLRTRHDQAGIARTTRTFHALQAEAIALGGSFYLTYHRAADRAQIEACYPRFKQFLELKRQYDPTERFTSDWYRHYAAMFRATA